MSRERKGDFSQVYIQPDTCMLHILYELFSCDEGSENITDWTKLAVPTWRRN